METTPTAQTCAIRVHRQTSNPTYADVEGRPTRKEPAFEQLVVDHRQRVTRLVYRLLNSPEDVEDVVQEVFLAALRGLGRFRGEADVSTWLSAIAVNKARTFRRRRLLRWQAWPRLIDQYRAGNNHLPVGEDDEHDEIRRAVERLSAKYREVVVLRYFEDLSIGEIAEILGISANNVEVRLTRARKRLREILS